MPIPAPATSLLIKKIPLFDSGIKGELTTPTGAAILSLFTRPSLDFPPIHVKKTGFGFGSYNEILGMYVGEKIK